jgi:hypothetical protein
MVISEINWCISKIIFLLVKKFYDILGWRERKLKKEASKKKKKVKKKNNIVLVPLTQIFGFRET